MYNTFKTNNIGQDISKELNSFNLNALKNQGRLLADYIETEPPFSMGLSRNRELLNRTYQVTTHHLFKLNNGQDIKENLVCQRHKEESAKEVESIYYEGQNEEWSLDEQEKSDYTKKSFSGTVTTEMNKPAYNLDGTIPSISGLERQKYQYGRKPNKSAGYVYWQ